MSIPAFQVISAGVAPVATRALAKARSVQVAGQALGAGQGGQGGDFARCVDGSGLGHVGDGQHAGLQGVDAAGADAGQLL
jgi:hypothetical protein